MTISFATTDGVNLGLASRSSRFIGQMIDGCVAAAPFMILTFATPFVSGVPAIVGGMAWMFFYLIFGDGLHDGQSFAKRWLGMRVVDARTGEPCTFGQSFVRNILLSILGPIDWIFIFGDRHQRLGDKAAGTIVIVAD